jgi:hypothetical protein
MDILTLELLDVTVFQALLELRELLAEHPGEALRIRGGDDLLCLNVASYLERQGRPARQIRQGDQWELQVPSAPRAQSVPSVPSVPSRPAPAPVLVLRSAFAPGDRALGRRLLLETLGHVPAGTPWVCLAHQAIELLDDPLALEVLQKLRGRGIPVRLSQGSLAHAGITAGASEIMGDETWQALLGQGAVTVL